MIISSAVQMYFNDNNDNLNQLMKGGWLTSRSMEYYFLNIKKTVIIYLHFYLLRSLEIIASEKENKKMKRNAIRLIRLSIMSYDDLNLILDNKKEVIKLTLHLLIIDKLLLDFIINFILFSLVY